MLPPPNQLSVAYLLRNTHYWLTQQLRLSSKLAWPPSVWAARLTSLLGLESPCQESARLHSLEQWGQQGPAQKATTHSHWASKLEAAHPWWDPAYPSTKQGCLHFCFHTNDFAKLCSPQKPRVRALPWLLRGCIKLTSCRCASCNLSTFCPCITNQFCFQVPSRITAVSFLTPVFFQDHTINPNYYTVYYSTTPTTVGVTMSKSEYKKNCLFSASHWVHPEAHTEFGHAQCLVS